MSKKVIYENSYGPRKRIAEQGETFDTATFKQLTGLIDSDIDFNNRLARVLSQILPVDRRAEMLRVLQQRNTQLQQMGRQEQQRARKQSSEQKKAADAYADTDSVEVTSRSYGSA